MNMNRETWKVFFAAAFGAGAGTLVAFEMSISFWWVGLIAGGLTGYFSYEWRQVIAAIPAAYRAARGWKATKHYWQAVGYETFLSMVVIPMILTMVILPLMISVKQDFFIALNESAFILCVIMGMTGFFSLVEVMALTKVDDTNLLSVARNFRYMIYIFFPPVVLFWHLPRGMWWVVKWLPGAIMPTSVAFVRSVVALVRFLSRFSWQFFLLIHSERRLICGVDAMLGAAVGYYVGSAIVGAVAGGVFGAVNYAVVTERWLKPRGFLPVQIE